MTDIKENSLHTRSPHSYDFSASQLRTLEAVFEAIYPGFEGPTAEEILKHGLSSYTEDWQREKAPAMVKKSFKDYNLMPTICHNMRMALSPTVLKNLMMLVSALSTRIGCAFLVGGLTPFADLSLKEREAVVLGWSTSSIAPLRQLFWGLSGFPLLALYQQEEIQRAIGYPARAEEVKRNAKHVQQPYEYKFVQPKDKQVLETDYLIIGSGAGGGVTASELAKAGHRVLVAEKGTYFKNTEIPEDLTEAYRARFEGEGVLVSEDGSMNVLIGSTFGGGTAINWGASLRPQHFVRTEWSEAGLPHFLSNEFNDAMDYICERSGISAKNIYHNRANVLLKKGCDRLGYHVADAPQNSGPYDHDCGYCTYGCPYGVKQGGLVTWLRDAAEHGAEFLQGAHAERVLFSNSASPAIPSFDKLDQTWPTRSQTHANGALILLDDGSKVIVHAKKGVVCCGGAINSPALLLRSKLTSPQIGKGLHLHPCTLTQAVFDEPVNQHKGAALTMVSNVMESHDGQSYGPKIETLAVNAGGWGSLYTTFRGAASHREMMLQYPHTATLIILTRDKDGGSVVIDVNGKPRINYSISTYDQGSMMHGLLCASKMMLASGAREVRTCQPTVQPFKVPEGASLPLSVADPGFVAWLKQVKAAGLAPGTVAMGSAHQMCTLRLGTSPRDSATDPRGKVWGYSGLYVSDASLFRTPSGSNPSVTCLSLAYSVAQWIKEDASSKQAA